MTQGSALSGELGRPAVSIGPALSGSFTASPGDVFRRVERLRAAEGDDTQVMVELPSHRLAQTTFCPTLALSRSENVRCRTAGGYQREPREEMIQQLTNIVRGGQGRCLPVPLLNGRGRWLLHSAERSCELHVYDSAAIVSGQEVISAFDRLWRESRWTAPVWAALSLNEDIDSEISLYQALLDPSAQTGGVSKRPPMLKVWTTPVTVEVVSEPYVVHGRRGYSPVINVREVGTSREQGLYIQAASLAAALEEIRGRRGRLSGARLRLARESASQYALYVVDEL